MAKMSLYRMGVPADICEDIIDIDQGGFTFVRCPQARRVWQRNIHMMKSGQSYTDIDKKEALPFEALRGVPQGDVPSPLCWDLFEDIVLTALDAILMNKVTVREGTGHLFPASDKCYADDLLIVTARLKALQDKADIMSAIAILFKMKINETKLRLFLLEHGQEHNKTIDPTIVIHIGPWSNVIELGIQRSGQMKSLGFVHGMGEDSTQQKITMNYLEKVCACISRKFASQETKLAGLKMHVYNKALYVGQFGSWSLAKFREWDVPISKCLKNHTQYAKSSKQTLIYAQRRLWAWTQKTL